LGWVVVLYTITLDLFFFSLLLQLRIPSLAHNIADLGEVQLYARVQTQNDFVLGRADELAELWKEARFGAARMISQLFVCPWQSSPVR
jgi:hypothetical protein